MLTSKKLFTDKNKDHFKSLDDKPFNIDNYINTLYTNIIGNHLEYTTQYGKKKLVYADFTASGRGLSIIEDTIKEQVLPFYANVHTQSGYLAEQSENFRNETKAIVRRYVNSDENDSIIFAGQGCTSCINKLIRILNLKEYIDFYHSIVSFKQSYIDFTKVMTKQNEKTDLNKLDDLFLSLNSVYFENIKTMFKKLFQITNFCVKNLFGSYNCTLCRMSFLQESQYNDHEVQEVHQLNLKKCANVCNPIFSCNLNYENFHELIDNCDIFEPIIFLSLAEHNSNALPWRETTNKIIYIDVDKENQKLIDYNMLEQELSKYKNNIIKIGTFTAASNITGIYTDTDLLASIMHKHNGLAFFDYACASPYIKIDMNQPLSKDYKKKLGLTGGVHELNNDQEKLAYKDGVFFSPHKFLGGPNTPGVLIIKQNIVRNLLVPSEPGGGVVLYVTKTNQNYVKNIEAREESGTPDIIGAIRIGLLLLLREKIPHDYITRREDKINAMVLKRFSKLDNLYVMGDISCKRIPIYSFLIKFNGKFLHYNFIASLLNDLFGVQSRGGCSCASTYGQECLGMNKETTDDYEKIVCSGKEIFRPGYVRLNLPYFYPDHVIEYIISSVEFVCKFGYLFLNHYAMKIESGQILHRHEHPEKRKWINQMEITNDKISFPKFKENHNIAELTKEELIITLKTMEDYVLNINTKTKNLIGKSQINYDLFFKEDEKLRWFLIPEDVEEFINENEHGLKVKEMRMKELDIPLKIKRQDYEFINVIHQHIQNAEDEKITGKDLTEHSQENGNGDKHSNEEDDKDFIPLMAELGIDETDKENQRKHDEKNQSDSLFPEIPKKILKNVGQAMIDFKMLKEGDRVLIGLSGGKDSISLVHILHNFQRKLPFKIEIGCVTVDPQSLDYNPSSLKDYMKKLNIPYFYESDPIMERAKKSLQNDSICSFCARMKRGIIYNCARREKYNIIALGQHLDDIAESFIMSAFHNGLLRTMKANYEIKQGDLRVIRPLIYCREKMFKDFALDNKLHLIQENCPACFSSPTERYRVKVLLAQQENLFPSLFSSILKAVMPLLKGKLEEGDDKEDDTF